MLALKPGSYRIELDVYIETAIKKDQFILYLRCGGVNSAREVAKLSLAASAEQWSKNRLEFSIDPDCPAQQIWISGQAIAGSDDPTLWLDNVKLSAL